MKTVEIGRLGEQYAAKFLKKQGYRILSKNVKLSYNELDIVALIDRDIVFVEVKTRSYHPSELDTAPPPSHAVNADKRRFTRQAARQYLHEHPTAKKPRMDVIEIWVDTSEEHKKPKVLKIHHMKGAY